MRFAGIDIGSRTIKLAVIENGELDSFPQDCYISRPAWDGAGTNGRYGI